MSSAPSEVRLNCVPAARICPSGEKATALPAVAFQTMLCAETEPVRESESSNAAQILTVKSVRLNLMGDLLRKTVSVLWLNPETWKGLGTNFYWGTASEALYHCGAL